jgi:hypothetical protein
MLLRIVLLAVIVLFTTTSTISAESESGGDDLRAKAQNPVSSMYSLPLKLTVDFGAPKDEAVFFHINPVIPVTIGNWNLVNRIIIPAVVSVDGFIGGTPDIPSGAPSKDRETGLGDINYSIYFSPADAKRLIWGIGPSINLSTANKDQLGSGKWSAGGAGIVLMQPKWGTYGGLIRQLWSFAGDDKRADVNQFLIEPFLNYNLEGGWYLLADSIIIANWDAPSGQRWTVPIGGGVGKLFSIGKQTINSRLEAYYMVERPDNAPDWQVIFTWQFLFPKK